MQWEFCRRLIDKCRLRPVQIRCPTSAELVKSRIPGRPQAPFFEGNPLASYSQRHPRPGTRLRIVVSEGGLLSEQTRWAELLDESGRAAELRPAGANS